MIKVIIFLVKVIATLICSIALGALITLSLLMWNEKFMIIGQDIIDEIWYKN
jgi:hypothetical protein